MAKEKLFHYELLLVINEKKKNESEYEKMIQELAAQVKIEKSEEKDWKTAYSIKQTTNISYMLVTFFSLLSVIPVINRILKPYPKDFLNRYLVINLNRERQKSIPKPKKHQKRIY